MIDKLDLAEVVYMRKDVVLIKLDLARRILNYSTTIMFSGMLLEPLAAVPVTYC